MAVALGNASLLGVGHLLLGHKRLAAIAVIGTALLPNLTASSAATCRTGKRVGPREVQIGGGSCPNVLRYEFYGIDPGPGDEFVSTSKSGVSDAFRAIVKR